MFSRSNGVLAKDSGDGKKLVGNTVATIMQMAVGSFFWRETSRKAFGK